MKVLNYLCPCCVFLSCLATADVDLIPPGQETSLTPKSSCTIGYLVPKSYPFRADAVSRDLDSRANLSPEDIKNIFALTSSGRMLKSALGSKRIDVKEMPAEMIDEFHKNVNAFAFPAGTYRVVDGVDTIFLRTVSITSAELLLRLMHEYTHVLNGRKNGPPLSARQKLEDELSAYNAADQFFEELAQIAPCVREKLTDYPKKMTEKKLREIDPQLNRELTKSSEKPAGSK